MAAQATAADSTTAPDKPPAGMLWCVVVTPEAPVLQTEARFVALPLFDGEIGVAPLHSPLIGRLGFGEMRIVTNKGTLRYYVDAGFVQVVADTVTVLTDRAVAADTLDAEIAAEQLVAARARPADSDELMAIRDRAVARARAQLRIARRGE